MSFPSRKIAEQEIELGEKLAPGKWGDHSRNVARFCEKVAELSGMDKDKAYVLGLMHDIGRRSGARGQKHIYDGYVYAKEKGWDDVAKISLTHSYAGHDADSGVSLYNGDFNDWLFIKEYIKNVQFDDYDKLVFLGDSMADATGICTIEKRQMDIALRYGYVSEMVEKWHKIFETKAYFEKKCGQSVYEIFPEIRNNI
ncbi:MAG: HD domain-containing protein [Alphaproteobacteria bacterium]|nr:HD domain-containing protein [Alphaproteobacteria bacterium]